MLRLLSRRLRKNLCGRRLSRGSTVLTALAGRGVEPAAYDLLPGGIVRLHALGMKKPDTWKRLGTLTDAIACRLARGQAQLEKPAAPGPKTESGGSVPPGRSARPKVKGAAIANRQTIALTAGERVGPDLGRQGVKVRASGPTAGGERRAGNVIDYREHAKLLAVWGPRGAVLPRRHRAAFSKSRRTAKSSSDTPSLHATTDQ